jgi:hypothetical protein
LLSIKYSHTQYQAFVRNSLSKYYIENGQHITVILRADLILKLWNADLTGIVDLLRHRYANSQFGAPPKDPVALLRSLILMTFHGETSISKWVETLRADPFYAILSGFLPACNDISRQVPDSMDPIPGVGTFYDFMNKLISKDRAFIGCRKRKRKRKRKPKKKMKKNQKYDNSKPGVIERIVKRVIKYSGTNLPVSAESSLNAILKDIFVMPSLRMGILGDISSFNIAGDGTCMPSNASHYGYKICNCEKGKSCDCVRNFTDPDASWGWDSYNESWFYGHSFHCFTACDSYYSLPLHIKCVTGERHDSVTGVYALAELVNLYPEIRFNTAAFDSAYDATYIYLLNLHYGIMPVIDLNVRSPKPASRNELIEYDENGIPHGKACGHAFRNWGLMQKSFRRKWLFPAQCDNCNKCPAKSNWCKYTPVKGNPRYFSPILRGSKEWRSYYKRRSTTERFWDRDKNDFNAKTAVVYSKEQRIVRSFLGAFCCYVDAWYDESSLAITDVFPELQSPAA